MCLSMFRTDNTELGNMNPKAYFFKKTWCISMYQRRICYPGNELIKNILMEIQYILNIISYAQRMSKEIKQERLRKKVWFFSIPERQNAPNYINKA